MKISPYIYQVKKRFLFSVRFVALILSFILFGATSKAQYVTIPDTAFVSWLQNNGFGGCMSGNQLDTTCGSVVNGLDRFSDGTSHG